MIYRINLQNFLYKAIDYFTANNIKQCNYAIISAKIANGSKSTNCVKVSLLYPLPELVIAYNDFNDYEAFEKAYFDQLNSKDNEDDRRSYSNCIYLTFVNPLLHHQDVVIVCDKEEDVYIDALCSYLKKKFEIEVIDLNELFTKGRIGEIYIDLDVIHDKAVDIRRDAVTVEWHQLETTENGRQKLLNMMTDKEKISKLKDLGIKINKRDHSDIDKILMDAWNEEFDNHE